MQIDAKKSNVDEEVRKSIPEDSNEEVQEPAGVVQAEPEQPKRSQVERKSGTGI